jgi:CheY-like chemotaxis protein
MTDSSRATRRKILVVDDEPSIVAYLTSLLEDNGYETCSVTDAMEAMTAVREESPDLITLDIMMPKRSGITLYQDLKLDPELRTIPIVFVSAFSRTNDFRPGSFRKMVPDERVPVPEAYIEKPIDIPVFLEAVASLLGPATADCPREGGAAS